MKTTRKNIHSEQIHGFGHSRRDIFIRVEELKKLHPGAAVTQRWNSRSGYYTINVSVEAEATRIQYRGICQFCGGSQAVDGDTIVLHGYKRPGDGYTHGRCAGARHLSLNKTDVDSKRWLAEAKAQVAKLTPLSAQAEKDERTAGAVWSASDETHASINRPRKTWHSWKHPSSEQQAEYETALATWAKRYPIFFGWQRSQEKASNLRAMLRNEQMLVDHLSKLIAAGYQGQKYTEVAK